jgi:hypothetical protein
MNVMSEQETTKLKERSASGSRASVRVSFSLLINTTTYLALHHGT